MTTISPNHSLHLPSSIKFQEHYHAPSISLLKKCTSLRELQQIHTQIIKIPTDQTHVSLAKLIESLVNLNHIDYARKVFDGMPEPSTFVFNTIVRGYGQSNNCNEGIRLYNYMRNSGVETDSFTYPFLLKACNSVSQGRAVHALILKSSEWQSDVYSQTSLVTFYSNQRDLESAQKVFDGMQERNVVSWTAMITGYVQEKQYDDGLALFRMMQVSAVEPNEMTLVNVLTACANLGAYEMGKWVHKFVGRNEVFVNPALGTALVDMYMKCGHANAAWQVFKKLPEKNVFAWNALIGGLAMHGFGEKALARFAEMLLSGVKPDDVTLLGVLSACAHSGLVDKGKEFFYSMERKFGIQPNIKHYGCLVDILGRVGLLNEAYDIVMKMPIEPNGVIWGTLLYSCSTHGEVELAEKVMERLVELEPFNDGNYVLLSNIYASKGRWQDVGKVRKFMRDRDILKTPGCSSIEVDNVIHEFIVGCSRHPHAKEIYEMLDDVEIKLKAEGYVPRISHVLHDISDAEKKRALCHHSEKLAIAFGLISTKPQTQIRVVKNLRACEDCHLATKLISKIYDREIIVRDRNRFHYFKGGTCSCGDFW